jgi:hypothetical protein
MRNIFLAFLIIASSVVCEAAPRKVLLELFTNSHCPLCPSAHSTIDAYLQNGLYKNQVTFIYYHMPFPYSDDLLHQHNPADANARNSFYGTFTSTPRAVFDGQIQSNNYSGWANIINNLAVQESPFTITLQGNSNGSNVNITTSITQTGSVLSSNLVAHFIAVETVNYSGRNGITVHKNTMRKMFPGSSGRSFSISLNQTLVLEEITTLNPTWILNNLGYLVFIQDTQTKTVFQSEFISYSDLLATNVEATELLPGAFLLEQNYPNPFNPSTTIRYNISRSSDVSIKVYNALGSEVAILVDEFKEKGLYEIEFDAINLSSGIYFYKISTGSFNQVKKMILLK